MGMQRVHRLNSSCFKTYVERHEVRNRFAEAATCNCSIYFKRQRIEAGEPYDALGGPPSVLETHPFKKQSRIKTVKAKSELACPRLDTDIAASGATKNLGVKGRLNKRPEVWRENYLAVI
ncbi:hypothetical protein AHF37_00151 [Paragonimus kellicotti]|nr:hypothetical protein AHF37_00151 [Paragonimus kellicotti]